VAAIQDFPRPTIIKELQAFLGMENFYRRFLPSIACTLGSLTDALRGGRKGGDKLEWSAAMDAASAGAKQSLLTATHLAHPTVGAELSVVVDASATHVGACLQQRLPGGKVWQPLGFFSKKLEAAQQKYSAFDRELFACYAGICHFRYMLDGRRFAIFTDHKPLTYALARVSEPWTARQTRQLSYVTEYTSDIRHITGAANVVADTLSRPQASLGGDLCKSALRVSGCSLAGRQAKLLSTFTSWRGGEHGRRAAGDWRVLPQDGGQPGQLSKHAAGGLVFLPVSKDCTGRVSQPAV
jgi:hypothetical protein